MQQGHLVLLTLWLTGCWHSVTVMVPASDVKGRQRCETLVTAGRVDPLLPGAYVENGFLVSQ
jgi:hypothetical protein